MNGFTLLVSSLIFSSMIVAQAQDLKTPIQQKTAVVFLENRLAGLVKLPCFKTWKEQLRQEGLDLDVILVDPARTTDQYRNDLLNGGSSVVGSILLGDLSLPTKQMTVLDDTWKNSVTEIIQTVLPLMNPSKELSSDGVDHAFFKDLSLWTGFISEGNHEKPLKERFTDYCEYFKRDVAYRTCDHSDHLKVVGYVDDAWKNYSDLNSIYSLSTDTTMVPHLQDIKKPREDGKDFDFGYIASHSNPYTHYPTGSEPITDDIIKYWNPPVKFFDLYACSAGNYTSWPDLAQTYLFSKSTLGVYASTKTGSIENPSKLYQHLKDGETFGEALVNYQRARLGNPNSTESDLSWIAGEVFYGDPTLRLYHCN